MYRVLGRKVPARERVIGRDSEFGATSEDEEEPATTDAAGETAGEAAVGEAAGKATAGEAAGEGARGEPRRPGPMVAQGASQPPGGVQPLRRSAGEELDPGHGGHPQSQEAAREKRPSGRPGAGKAATSEGTC